MEYDSQLVVALPVKPAGSDEGYRVIVDAFVDEFVSKILDSMAKHIPISPVTSSSFIHPTSSVACEEL